MLSKSLILKGSYLEPSEKNFAIHMMFKQKNPTSYSSCKLPSDLNLVLDNRQKACVIVSSLVNLVKLHFRSADIV